jgi:hypothetical protein
MDSVKQFLFVLMAASAPGAVRQLLKEVYEKSPQIDCSRISRYCFFF